eukprot:m.56790 g.56790  ORF g.56790 m.56790 type:complete len:753 (-) comp22292_c2_seq1:178-2436(-)
MSHVVDGVRIFSATGGKISSGEAQHKLQGHPPGSYCIRHSLSSPGGFGLSIAKPTGCKHYLIELSQRTGTYHIQDGKHFEDLSALVNFYKTETDGLAYLLTTNVLDLDAEKEEPPPRPPKRNSISSQAMTVIPEGDLKFGKELGSGQYGTVLEANWTRTNGKQLIVAVKCVKANNAQDDDANREEQIKEAKVIAQLQHPNIVAMYGICFSKTRGVSIVCELVPMGALNTFLIREEHSNTLTVTHLASFVKQIATGMEFMSSKNIVHRDLAARNVLVYTIDVVKISDFGLSRSMRQKEYYRAQRKGRWPIKWYAPECLYESLFTPESDVWSFAITSWEVFSYGIKPWRGFTATEVVQALANRIRLPKPDACPPKMYNLMLDCWADNRLDRPSFKNICQRMEVDIEPEVREIMKGIVPQMSDELGMKAQEFYDIVPADPEEVAAEVAEEHLARDKRRVYASFKHARAQPSNVDNNKLCIAFKDIVSQFHITLSDGKVSASYNAQLKQGAIMRPVTVKAVDVQQCDPEAFLNEVKILVALDSPYIIRFLGIVPPDEHPQNLSIMVTEQLPYGSVDAYLKNRPQNVEKLLKFCTQVAAGMVYLEQKGVLHCYLAAHNVLVRSESAVTIGNFGMSRVLQMGSAELRGSRKGRWQLKWCAPESILQNSFSMSSEVWSYGVTAWEILSNGENPYGSHTNGHEVLKFVQTGGRLDIPKLFTKGKYDTVGKIIAACWKKVASDRPSMAQVHRVFHQHAPEA